MTKPLSRVGRGVVLGVLVISIAITGGCATPGRVGADPAANPSPEATGPSVDQQIEAARQRTLNMPDTWSPPPSPPPTPEPTPTGPATSFDDGTYVVGTDIVAGTYKAKPSSGHECYWARLSSTASESDIIANHFASGPTTVAISKSDAAFVTQRCGRWTKVR